MKNMKCDGKIHWYLYYFFPNRNPPSVHCNIGILETFIVVYEMRSLPCSCCQRYYRHKHCSFHSIWFPSWSRTFRRAYRWPSWLLLAACNTASQPQTTDVDIAGLLILVVRLSLRVHPGHRLEWGELQVVAWLGEDPGDLQEEEEEEWEARQHCVMWAGSEARQASASWLGRLYVNTASNEIIGDLGIIMDWMDNDLGTRLARKESGGTRN